MSHIKRNPVLRAFVFCLVLIIIGPFCFSYLLFNGSTGVYNQNPQPPGIQGNISMEILVAEGAGHFLKVHSKVQMILNMMELQDIRAIDYIKLNQMVKNALIDIINARSSFEELIKIAEVTHYDNEVIGKLNRFDYDSVLKEYGLNPFIFGTVREYLEKGDITGTYKYAYVNFKEIEQLLLNIQSSITENRIPELEILWRINERCAEAALFGSYIARIFKAIR